MQLEKPKSNVRRVYVTAKDAETGQSKSTTLYQTTPEAVIASVEETARRSEENAEKSELGVREPASSANS